MESLVHDANPISNSFPAQADPYRKAGAEILRKVRASNSAYSSFVYTDARGSPVKMSQMDSNGKRCPNIILQGRIKDIHDAATAEYQSVDSLRFRGSNNIGFVRQVQRYLCV